MIGCIWSCPTDQMLRFPSATMIRFCHNHGLIQVADRPQWHTVRAARSTTSSACVAASDDARLARPCAQRAPLPAGQGSAGVLVSTDHGSERFDDVVLACHSDQSLALLGRRHADERSVLGAIRYHPTARCCTPTPRCCRAPQGLGRLELRARQPTARASRPPCACTT
jgi:predicted NAD/FAD-binding protein